MQLNLWKVFLMQNIEIVAVDIFRVYEILKIFTLSKVRKLSKETKVAIMSKATNVSKAINLFKIQKIPSLLKWRNLQVYQRFQFQRYSSKQCSPKVTKPILYLQKLAQFLHEAVREVIYSSLQGATIMSQ